VRCRVSSDIKSDASRLGIPKGAYDGFWDSAERGNDVVAGTDTVSVRITADDLYWLYEDTGDGYAYEEERLNRISLRWDDAKRTLTVGSSTQRFPQSLAKRGGMIRTPGKARLFDYDGSKITLTV